MLWFRINLTQSNNWCKWWVRNERLALFTIVMQKQITGMVPVIMNIGYNAWLLEYRPCTVRSNAVQRVRMKEETSIAIIHETAQSSLLLISVNFRNLFCVFLTRISISPAFPSRWTAMTCSSWCSKRLSDITMAQDMNFWYLETSIWHISNTMNAEVSTKY